MQIPTAVGIERHNRWLSLRHRRIVPDEHVNIAGVIDCDVGYGAWWRMLIEKPIDAIAPVAETDEQLLTQ